MAKKTTKMKLTDTLKEKIRVEYVQGSELTAGERTLPSLDELITKHRVAKTTLYRASASEGWKAQRERFQYEYMAKLDAERTKSLVEESRRLDNNSISLAKILMATVGQQVRKNSQDISEGKQGLNAAQVFSLSNAALASQKLAKIALGESTQNINLNANIQDNTAFQRAMELLDSVADQRRQGSDSALH